MSNKNKLYIIGGVLLLIIILSAIKMVKLIFWITIIAVIGIGIYKLKSKFTKSKKDVQ